MRTWHKKKIRRLAKEESVSRTQARESLVKENWDVETARDDIRAEAPTDREGLRS